VVVTPPRWVRTKDRWWNVLRAVAASVGGEGFRVGCGGRKAREEREASVSMRVEKRRVFRRVQMVVVVWRLSSAGYRD
jgi:hypothetical protein